MKRPCMEELVRRTVRVRTVGVRDAGQGGESQKPSDRGKAAVLGREAGRGLMQLRQDEARTVRKGA